MSDIAETLRSMANEEEYAGDLIIESARQGNREIGADAVFLTRRRKRQAACEAGAAAWALVQRLAEIAGDGHIRWTDEKWERLCDVLDEARSLVTAQADQG